VSTESVAELKRVLELCHEQLRYAHEDYERLLIIAMTGEGLEEIRQNDIHQATVRRITARKELKNVVQLTLKKRI
jgi:hypothetical protein